MDHKSHKISVGVVCLAKHLKLAKNFHRYQIKIPLSFVYISPSVILNIHKIWKQLCSITILRNRSVGQKMNKSVTKIIQIFKFSVSSRNIFRVALPKKIIATSKLRRIGIQLLIWNLLRWICHKFLSHFSCSEFLLDQKHWNNFKI